MIDRRTLVATGLLAAMGGRALATKGGETGMYGMIGKIAAQPGQRGELIRLLLEGSGGMPGCLSYIVAEDLKDPDTIWVSEAWDSKESHAASLKLPAVQAAIARARPLIAGFDTAAEVRPVGGLGLGAH